MKNKGKGLKAASAAMMTGILFSLISGTASAETNMEVAAVPTTTNVESGGIDINAVQQTASTVSLESMIQSVQEFSVPILVILIILAAASAIGGLVYKPMRAAAGGFLGIGILFYVLVNNPEKIAGILISIGDGFMKIVTGG